MSDQRDSRACPYVRPRSGSERLATWGSIIIVLLALLGLAASAGATKQTIQDHDRRIGRTEAEVRMLAEKIDDVADRVRKVDKTVLRVCTGLLGPDKCLAE